MKFKKITQVELQHIINTNTTEELFIFLESNVGSLFSTLDIPNYYRLLKDIDVLNSKRILPKLIYAWMAFLSGDHPKLFLLLNNINEIDLHTPEESSFFYALKAFTSSMLSIEDALRYAKLSVDILSEEPDSIYKANGFLTYGQLLSGTDQYRLAASMFNSSAKIFYSLDLNFLAVIGTVNELLNLYKIGEYQKVITKCNEELLKAGCFKGSVEIYWNLLSLPLGMCYYELYKPNLALHHLLLAKKCIDQNDLFHMHGMNELYLFKTYYILKDYSKLDLIYKQFERDFGSANYPEINLLISMFKIYSIEELTKEKISSEIENFEIEFETKKEFKSYSVVIEVLVFLKLKGLSDVITANDLIDIIEKFRYIGNISHIQLTLIELCEILLENNENEALVYLNEAISIYKQYGISANFHLVPLKSHKFIKSLDINLYNSLNIKKDNDSIKMNILTSREKDIINLISRGKSNDDISNDLYISVGTVKWHINNIFSKLGVKNRVQAIDKAKELHDL